MDTMYTRRVLLRCGLDNEMLGFVVVVLYGHRLYSGVSKMMTCEVSFCIDRLDIGRIFSPMWVSLYLLTLRTEIKGAM